MKIVICLLCLVYLVACGLQCKRIVDKTGNNQKASFFLVLGIFLPVAGPVFYLFCERIGSLYAEKDYADFYISRQFKQDNLGVMQRLNAREELNRVPMSEALRLSEPSYRRDAIIRLLGEEDLLQYLDVLKEALLNEDTETSHYASVVIMDLQQTVQTKLQQIEYQYNHNPDDPQCAQMWEQILFEVLRSKLYDDYSYRRCLAKYLDVSDKLLAVEVPRRKDLRHRTKVELMRRNYTAAQEFCTRYLNLYPDSEEAVLAQLRILMDTRDAGGMREFLRTLSQRPVMLTTKTLDYIRVFEKRGVV